jgi:hypothetical protein
MELALYNHMSPLFPKTNSLDISYSVLVSYFIGIFTGIFITLEYSTRYSVIKDTDTKGTNTMDTDTKETDTKETDTNDEDDEDYIPDEDDDEDDIEEIRNVIETLFIKKNNWNCFVSMNKIYKKVSMLYPEVTQHIIKEAMKMEPPYVTGTEHGKKGYRYIICV